MGFQYSGKKMPYLCMPSPCVKQCHESLDLGKDIHLYDIRHTTIYTLICLGSKSFEISIHTCVHLRKIDNKGIEFIVFEVNARAYK